MPGLLLHVIFFAALGGATLAAAEPLLEKIDLFEAGKDGYALYRIPGIAVTRTGTALAYCEARKTDRGDWGAIDIYLRRSEDGGRTWAQRTKVAGIEGPHRKNPAALAQGLAGEGEVTYNNPVVIPDAKTGAVHLLFCYEYMRAFYMRSDDDGRTFSKPVEITSAFEGFRSRYPWRVLATGPGHGIQLRTGRLVVPVWISTATGGHAHRPSVSSVIYSDDHGKTWRAGDIAIPDTPEFVIPNEAAVVELADGRVMLNARSESNAHRRIVVYSKDGATGWSRPSFQHDLLEPICMAGLARLTVKPKDDRNRLLFSNPDNLDRRDGKAEPGRNRDRRNLTVKLSYDEGGTWRVAKPLEPGWSGYSDLAVAGDGTILCFYERGGLAEDHFKTAALTLARFNVEWLTSGDDRLSREKP
ncbi:MAG: exo-alpha-sialidase [Bryobacteraceae bacterium]|nr:exo-alpha-sialidase [Bryobacteraceae bacterium]